MMEIKINKEVRSYTESIFFGLSLRQFLYALFACMIAVWIYFNLINVIGMELTSWACIFGAVPFACFGFITFQSMTLEEIIIHMLRSLLLKHRNLISQPYNLYMELNKIMENENKKEKNYVKKFIKIQKSK